MRPDGHRALHGDDGVALQMAAQAGGHVDDMGEVGLAVIAPRGVHRDEDHLRLGQRLRQGVREADPAGGGIRAQQRGPAGLGAGGLGAGGGAGGGGGRGATPPVSCASRSRLTSTPTTWWPRWASPTAVIDPTYPAPPTTAMGSARGAVTSNFA